MLIVAALQDLAGRQMNRHCLASSTLRQAILETLIKPNNLHIYAKAFGQFMHQLNPASANQANLLWAFTNSAASMKIILVP